MMEQPPTTDTSAPANAMDSTKVVSSNPTLNLLLSTPVPVPVADTTAVPRKRNLTKRIMLNPSAGKSQHRRSPLTALPPPKPISYLDEIRKMMHGFGDVRNANVEAARMIESIVQHQMSLLVMEAQAVAQRRQSRHIGVEEFLFLLRHDRHKLAKLVRYLRFKDLKLKLMAIDSSSSSSPGKPAATGGTKASLERLYQNVVKEEFCQQEETADEQSKSANPAPLKRAKLCQEFLRSLDGPQGELSRLLLDTDMVDEISLARNRRLNEFTQAMSVKEYLYYQSCRMVTFFGTSSGAGAADIAPATLRRFQDWVLLHAPADLELRPNQLGWEVIQYLAYETVAILVELSLMVRADLRRPARSGRPLYAGTVECEVMPRATFQWASAAGSAVSTKPAAVTKYEQNSALATEVLRLAADKMVANGEQEPDPAVAPSPAPAPSPVQPPTLTDEAGIAAEHILEAMRRFESGAGVLCRFARCHGWAAARNPRTRILAIR